MSFVSAMSEGQEDAAASSEPVARETARHRFPALDSLRGIAALTVVTYHLLDAMPNLSWRLFYRTPLSVLLIGPESVLLFFVLSGFVLTLQLQKHASYLQYVTQRICRIYLPYLAAIGASLVALALVPHTHVPWLTVATWQNLWTHPIDASTMSSVLAFIFPSTKTTSLDPVVWSLVYEMRISLIFPLVLIGFRRLGIRAMLGLGAVLSAVVCSTAMPGISDYVREAIGRTAWLPTLHYLFFFIMGAALALRREAIISLLRSPRLRLALLAVSLAVYGAPDLTLHRLMHLPEGMLAHDWMIGAAVCGIIACSIGPYETSRVLQAAPLRYLGKISYSLYLFHPIVFLIAMHALGERSTYWGAVLTTALLCVPVADVAYRLVEAPSIRLGRFLATKAGRPSGAPAKRIDGTSLGMRA